MLRLCGHAHLERIQYGCPAALFCCLQYLAPTLHAQQKRIHPQMVCQQQRFCNAQRCACDACAAQVYIAWWSGRKAPAIRSVHCLVRPSNSEGSRTHHTSMQHPTLVYACAVRVDTMRCHPGYMTRALAIDPARVCMCSKSAHNLMDIQQGVFALCVCICSENSHGAVES